MPGALCLLATLWAGGAMATEPPRNVEGGALVACCQTPKTGFARDGFCRAIPHDPGLHVVCAVVTRAFLDFTRERGNDLETAHPEAGFPGLKPGDRWCLCASRWAEAEAAGKAPPVVLAATDQAALQHISLETLRHHAHDRADPPPPLPKVPHEPT